MATKKPTKARPAEDEFLSDKDWITLTKAGFILNARYLKVRDLSMQGVLGEVRSTRSGRYFVRETSVRTYKQERDAKRAARRAPGSS